MDKYLLHIKAKEDKYIRLILSSEENTLFIEKYIDFNEWQSIENSFLCIREEINKKIRNNLFPRIELRNLKNDVESFLKKFLFYPENEIIRLKVIWQANIFLPLEICKRNLEVLNFISSDKKSSKNSNNVVLIYSDDINHSKEENFILAGILKDRNKNLSIEYFSENDFDSYRSDLLSARLIHFSTHGRVNHRKGEISLNGNWCDSLNQRLNAEIVFLNSCEAGCYPEGIVSNLLSSGAECVIASPFELYDNLDWQKKLLDFYKSFDFSKEAEKNYLEFRNKNYLFALFFRLFNVCPAFNFLREK
ncbi:MAG: hypothetical protein ACP5QT_07015 [Brevinematia bacterium]